MGLIEETSSACEFILGMNLLKKIFLINLLTTKYTKDARSSQVILFDIRKLLEKFYIKIISLKPFS